ncbi:MAG: glycosyltransferase family 2 protein [Planctomycetes bacterium]|nr:glycosyltransferase family 2 protein [Planctomycetota bacterium]
MSKVSVIIPTYNRSSWVLKSINSVLEQSYNNLECLVIDDGSTDETGNLVKEIKDKRLKYIYQKHLGVAAARNRGLYEMEGEFVAFLDSDSIWPNDFLFTMIKTFKENPSFGAAYAKGFAIDDVKKCKAPSSEKRRVSGWITKHYFKNSPCLLPPAMCFRKSAWNNLYWDENLESRVDYDVFLRMTKNTKFFFVPDTYVKIGDPESGLSNNRKEHFKKIYEAYILERFYRYLGGNKLVSRRDAGRKIRHRYRKAAKSLSKLGAQSYAIKFYKKAIYWYPVDLRLYLDLLSAQFKKNSYNKKDIQIPPCLPNHISFAKKRQN